MKNQNQNEPYCKWYNFNWIEISVISLILMLLASIVISNFLGAKQTSLLYEHWQKNTSRIDVVPGSLIELANKIGSEGVAENPIGFGDSRLKGIEIIDGFDRQQKEVTLASDDEAKQYYDVRNESGSLIFRDSTARELLSLGAAEVSKLETNSIIVAKGSYVLSANSVDLRFPIIRVGSDGRREVDFMHGPPWPTNALFALTKIGK